MHARCCISPHASSILFPSVQGSKRPVLLQVLLAGAVQDAQTEVLKLPLLSPSDAETVLEGFNPAPQDASVSQLCLHNLFEKQAGHQPDAPCIRTPQETLSYGDVEQRANAWAHILQSKGVGPQSVVGVMLDRTATLYIAILAVLKTGAAYLPMDSGYPEDRLSFMASDAAIQVLLTTQDLAKAVESIEAEVGLHVWYCAAGQ